MTSLDAANELFQLTDVLAGQPMLRRALSDPSAQPERRAELARKLFGSRVSDASLDCLERVVKAPWRDADDMMRAVELDGVKAALHSAQAEDALTRVTSELHVISDAVGSSAELTTTLRNSTFSLESRRGLIAKLHGPDVHPVTALLAARAVSGHRRSYTKTIDDYLDEAAEISQALVAKVTVARPLDQARLERLRAALAAKTGRPVSVQMSVDPDILGGINVAIGHDVYESTVAGRLEDVRRQLIHS
ncbi:F0F1 ATP synthase subunit delta [uncultured Tessaracoccus sp.]|uniref:F0F1 ATP synthase subunit delta n=1 Tax=uncultured Tessaracoccus sp. TaxID=905023 RepID=UPI00260FAF18|nr:F0F1 ATP synthase subunit delta [uncultured Tessaracoccus sp.]